MTTNQAEFLSLIYANCIIFADDYDIKAVPAIVAQSIVESNWGKSTLAKKYFNYFGLKCGSNWKGKSVNLKTKEEYTVGELTTIKDNFRVYNDMESGVHGYFDFINTKRYRNLKGIDNPYMYLNIIWADGYATSSRYVDTCAKVLSEYVLPWLDGTDHEYNLEDIALEVIAGKWGNGRDRRDRLEAAGYNYKLVQSEVNKIYAKNKH